MASLLIGSAILISEKVKNKKAAKKEAKREAYEKRYKELEDEHQKTQRSRSNTLEKSQTGQSHATQGSSDLERKTSHESLKDDDGPSQWVNDVYLQRTGSRPGTS